MNSHSGDKTMRIQRRINIAVILLVAVAGHAWPQAVVAPTPPMGWNSWDCYGTTVTEAEVKANADFMAKNLAKHGWQYIVVDIQWSEPNAKSHGYIPNTTLTMDQYGRLIPAPNRFPSAADGKGFKPLADYVHSKGLKFGIHIMRGIPRQAVKANAPVFGSNVKAADIADPQSVCRWNTDMFGVDMTKPRAQDYYDSIVKMYADWGVDFIKADDMSAQRGEEVRGVAAAIKKSGRPIVLSLSPGQRDVTKAAFYAENAQMWRISGDFWDRWMDLKRSFNLVRTWSPYVKPGTWPDADMLPLGHIGIRAERGDDRKSLFTPDEQKTLMTLWSIARSPLMFGGDLPSSDAATVALITNDEVLEANQKGDRPRELFTRGDEVAWISDAPDGKSKYLAVFNVGDSGPLEVKVNWSELGLPGACALRDLWAKKTVGAVKEGQAFSVPAHGAAFYRLTPVASGAR
jgi:alpha-galactosidase